MLSLFFFFLPGQVAIDLDPAATQGVQDPNVIIGVPDSAVVGERERNVVKIALATDPAKVAAAIVGTLAQAAANLLALEPLRSEDVVTHAAPDVTVLVPAGERFDIAENISVEDLANLNQQVMVRKSLSAVVLECLSFVHLK